MTGILCHLWLWLCGLNQPSRDLEADRPEFHYRYDFHALLLHWGRGIHMEKCYTYYADCFPIIWLNLQEEGRSLMYLLPQFLVLGNLRAKPSIIQCISAHWVTRHRKYKQSTEVLKWIVTTERNSQKTHFLEISPPGRAGSTAAPQGLDSSEGCSGNFTCFVIYLAVKCKGRPSPSHSWWTLPRRVHVTS